MERLTEKDQYSQDYKIQAKNLNSHCVAKDTKGYITYYGQHIDKLAKYENLEEQGRLVILPCKDVYYIVDINNPRYAMVMRKSIRELAIYEIEDIDKENCKYFSTKEKAEARLKELRCSND